MASDATGLPEIRVLRQLNRTTDFVVRANLAGVTQAESLVAPGGAGNCLNWILGHLVIVYDKVLPMLGQAPVRGEAALARYDRGSAPLTEPSQALPLAELLEAWGEQVERVDAGLAALPAAALDAPCPDPDGDPSTVRAVLTLVMFHQAYHAGQTGVLRRVAGHPRAIA